MSIDLISALHAAVFALKTARNIIPTLQSHHERCNNLVDRCQHLIVNVCGQSKTIPASELEWEMKIVVEYAPLSATVL